MRSSVSSGTSRGPIPEAFRILPWQSEVLDGLLGNDLLGFHLQYHCNNFLETVDRSMEARIDQETFSVHCRGHRTAIRPYPISIDPSTWNGMSPGSAWTQGSGARRAGVSTSAIGASSWASIGSTTRRAFPIVCWRSIDSSSAIPSGEDRVVLVQVGSPTRDRIDRYRDLSREVGELVDEDQRPSRHAGLDPDRLPARVPHARRTWRRCIARPTSASCPRCTTA